MSPAEQEPTSAVPDTGAPGTYPDPIVRPAPHRWLWYALGGRLPERHRGWVLFDTTTRTWGLRHVGRMLVQMAVPIVLILVLLPALAPAGGADWQTTVGTLLKVAFFVGLMLLAGARLVPWLLITVARARSRELFILAILALALGTALGSAVLFGVSLALGAFLAGVVVATRAAPGCHSGSRPPRATRGPRCGAGPTIGWG